MVHRTRKQWRLFLERGRFNKNFDKYKKNYAAVIGAASPGTVVILDNLSIYKSPRAAEALKQRQCWFLFLPPCCPDLTPIEQAFAKLMADLRRIGART